MAKKKFSTVLCAAANKKRVYIAVYETDSASNITLFLLRSNVRPKSLQRLTWETVASRSMDATHLIGRKRRPLLNACAVDDAGSVVLLSHETAPQSTSVRASPDAVWDHARWDEVPRGLVYDPHWSKTWKNVDVLPNSGCLSRLDCQTLIYTAPPSNGGASESTFVAAHFSTNTSHPSATPFVSFSVLDWRSRTFVRQTPNLEINLETFHSKQLGYHNEKLLLYYCDTWPCKIKTRNYNLDQRGLPTKIHSEQTHPLPTSDDTNSSNSSLPTTFDIRHAGAANGLFTFLYQIPNNTTNDVYTFNGSKLFKKATFENTATTPLLPFEFLVPVPGTVDRHGHLATPQWILGFSGSNSYGIWTSGPQAGQWHRLQPSSIVVHDNKPMSGGQLLVLMALGPLLLYFGYKSLCSRRRQRSQHIFLDPVEEIGVLI